MQKLPAKLFCGPDGTPSVFLKKLYSSLSLPLSLLFQKSYNSGKLPSEWRIAYVVPIYKGRSKKSECRNYRPISLTSSVCKVKETYICQHLENYCDTNNLISDVQHGSRSKRSTQSNMLEMCNFMVNIIDCGNNVDLITIDLCKAFDSIPHNKLIHELPKYGIIGKILNWISSFLNNRVFNVRSNSEYSNLFLWCTKWGLKINYDKCKVIHFGSKNF